MFTFSVCASRSWYLRIGTDWDGQTEKAWKAEKLNIAHSKQNAVYYICFQWLRFQKWTYHHHNHSSDVFLINWHVTCVISTIQRPPSNPTHFGRGTTLLKLPWHFRWKWILKKITAWFQVKVNSLRKWAEYWGSNMHWPHQIRSKQAGVKGFPSKNMRSWRTENRLKPLKRIQAHFLLQLIGFHDELQSYNLSSNTNLDPASVVLLFYLAGLSIHIILRESNWFLWFWCI